MNEREGADRIVTPTASVSVVLPCFRCKGTIRRAVASVAQQSLVPTELILVDDASGDGTLEFLIDLQREFGERWVRIIALDRNSGPASVRNAGWDAASGRYVAFLDGDDAWHPRKIEIQYAFMEAHPEVVLCGHGHRQLGSDDSLNTPLRRPGYQPISFGALLLSNRFISPSAMVRRDISQRFQAGKRRLEDHLLWAEIASARSGVARLNEVLAFTFKAPVGASGLSANIWEMRKAELANFWTLRRSGHLDLVATLALSCYSLVKHVARSLALAVRRSQG